MNNYIYIYIYIYIYNVYIYMCVCVCVCVCVCMYVCMDGCMDGWMHGWMDGCITETCNIGYIYLYYKGSTINGDNGYHSLTLGLLVLCNICMPLIFQSMTAALVGDNIALQKLSEILEVLLPFHSINTHMQAIRENQCGFPDIVLRPLSL